jgi:cell division protein FtsW (lipid II flippase)
MLTGSVALDAGGVPARARRRSGVAAAVPALLELILVGIAIAALLPSFDRVAELGAGRGARFRTPTLGVANLPASVLGEACASAGARAEAPLRDALCGRRIGAATAVEHDALPAFLAGAVARTDAAFGEPVRAAEARIAALRRAAADGDAGLRDSADAASAIEAELGPFVKRYGLGAAPDAGPAALHCAARLIDARATPSIPLANAVLLLAAALDGRALVAPLAADAALPSRADGGADGCAGGAASLAATATLMAEARQSVVNARKDEAMRALLRSAGWQWAAAMALGFGFVVWSRFIARPLFGVAVALGAWAGLAWLGRVAWPLGGGRDFVLARAGESLTSAPAPFVLALLGATLLMGIGALIRKRAPAQGPVLAQSMSSRVGYPGFVVATGLGWLLLFDLSLDGHVGNRYLALYHQSHLWLALLTLSLLVLLRRSLGRRLAWALSLLSEASARAGRRLGAGRGGALLIGVTLSAVLGFGIALANMRQLTSELGRIWLIGGAAWFFFLRAAPLTERIARSGPAALSFLRYAWPILFVAGVLVAAMFATRDMGPLLIAGYASGAFVAASVAMWWHHRSGHVVASALLAVLLFGAWIAAITGALFQVGAYDSVTASRLESVAAPFASINDQLALVSWFQRAAPVDGFGIGHAPWCGFGAARGCSGVPAQIHSDYTFTALVGVFGSWLGTAFWLHRLIRHHGRVTRGEPRLVADRGRFVNDGQALLSWLGVAWVVLTSCQLAVTVAGNLAVLPLTGVTFPFVSFGMTSLLVNIAFLALCLNVDLPAAARHG